MLTTLIGLPIIGAILLFAIPDRHTNRIRGLSIAIAGLLLFIAITVLTQFDLTNPSLQMQEYIPWIPKIGLDYKLGIDGLSMPLLVLGNLLTLIAILSSSPDVHRPRFFYALILLVNAGVVGSFLAQNVLLFVLFYELELIPLYLLIAIWGGERRDYAAIKFLIYTALSGVLILVGFLALALANQESFTFDYTTLQTQAQLLPIGLQTILLTVLLIGFGIKTPLVPFHTWLPDTYVEASTPVAMLLGGVLAKLGTYGLVRFCLGLFPEAWSNLAPILAIWGTVSVMYGALAAIAQKDIKRMVAYSSIGHMGYVLLAAAALNTLSLVGGVSQMVSHGLILAALFHLVGVIETKVGTRELDVLNGLLNPIRGLPATSALLVMMGMASAGIPGMMGFVAEFLVFQGSFPVFPLPTLICIIGTGLTAVYFVILLNRTCFGKLDNDTAYYPKVTVMEQAPALILAGLIVFMGFQPIWMTRWSETTMAALVAKAPIPASQKVAMVSDRFPFPALK